MVLIDEHLQLIIFPKEAPREESPGYFNSSEPTLKGILKATFCLPVD